MYKYTLPPPPIVVASTRPFLRYVNKRFPESLPSKAEFAAYMHTHWQGPQSGEKALSALLLPGALQRWATRRCLQV